MKKLILSAFTALLLAGCGPKINDLANVLPINAKLDLVNVKDDKVQVEIDPGRFTSETVNFYIPKTVPGTYSDDNYGKFIEDLVALDYKGKPLQVTKTDINTWQIQNATHLDKITYWVNDSFDTENQVEEAVFSPAGSNIDKGRNFFLNLHMFVGYFDGLSERPYRLSFLRPQGLQAATSLTKGASTEANTDVFLANRYFEVTDNPVMYSQPDSQTFRVNDIEVTLSVYSPNKLYSALSLRNEMERMMKAQKAFLGDINSTKKYNILVYLSTMEDNDATGFGALEHHTSTTVVMPETVPKDALLSSMTDVVSHEFFHIVTPLTVHSEEVHYFNYNDPKMSEHLWMYEGVTEYFANLFQVQEALIDDHEFYNRMMDKIENAKMYDDHMSFTEMSRNVLKDPYKPNYANVYEKGALIGMCLDLIIREHSNGEKGILWLMKELSAKYGQNKPFKDEQIIDEIVALTYPEVGAFFREHVIGNTPIDYAEFLSKAGLTFSSEKKESTYFFIDQMPFIDLNTKTNEIYFRKMNLNSFWTSLGVESGDVIRSINGEAISMNNIRNIIGASFGWQPGSDFSMVVKRGEEELTLSGKIIKPEIEVTTLVEKHNASEAEETLRKDWLRDDNPSN